MELGKRKEHFIMHMSVMKFIKKWYLNTVIIQYFDSV